MKNSKELVYEFPEKKSSIDPQIHPVSIEIGSSMFTDLNVYYYSNYKFTAFQLIFNNDELFLRKMLCIIFNSMW